MGVDVDKAGRHQLAPGVDLFRSPGGNLPDLGDAAILDGDIGFEQITTASIRNVPAADHKVRTGRGHGALIPFCEI